MSNKDRRSCSVVQKKSVLRSLQCSSRSHARQLFLFRHGRRIVPFGQGWIWPSRLGRRLRLTPRRSSRRSLCLRVALASFMRHRNDIMEVCRDSGKKYLRIPYIHHTGQSDRVGSVAKQIKLHHRVFTVFVEYKSIQAEPAHKPQ